MYLEFFHLNSHPFAETPDAEIFFQEGGRGEILNKVMEDFINGEPLVRVTGGKGTGKTLLCKCLLQQPLGRQFDFVYLDNPVGSLNDLLYEVCVGLGMDSSAGSGRDMFAELQGILSLRKDSGKKVLLIIDEAEKLFLAALERLMRLICETGEDHILHILLAGRPALVENLNQLTSYCSDVDVHLGYKLTPFTPEETARYLDFRLKAAGISENRRTIFTADTVNKITAVARGDLHQVNILADKALQAACSANSSEVLPLHIGISGEKKEEKRAKRVILPPAVQEKKIWLSAAGILALLILLFSMFTGKSSKDTEDIISIPEQRVEKQSVPEQKPEVQPASDQQTAVPSGVVVPEPEVLPPTPEISPPEVIEIPEEVIQDSVFQEAQEQAVVELRPGKIKTAPSESRKTVVIIEPPARHEPPAVKYKAVPVNSIQVPILGEQIFQERIRASAKWLANAYHNRYTVQMMMLASEQAAPNIKRMLAQDEYAAIKDYLYILTKKTSPPTLFIFYGTYGSMEQARQARNSMPLFLRKHHPYALSISDAMKKTQD